MRDEAPDQGRDQSGSVRVTALALALAALSVYAAFYLIVATR